MKFIILGSGSSMGVPRADGFFGECDPKNPKNYRLRCSALINSGDINILIELFNHKYMNVLSILYQLFRHYIYVSIYITIFVYIYELFLNQH